MSTAVRVLAITLGAAAAGILYFAWHFPWYVAVVAGVAVLIVFPICQEFIAGVRRRETRDENDRRRRS